MPLKNTGTETLIKETAKRLFFAEGKLHATTQEIADAAGVNRTSLHYYFRSRDLLLEAVFKEAMQALSGRMNECMAAEKPFRQKIEDLIEVFLKDMTAFPYQETFLVTEINTLGKELIENIKAEPINNFLTEVKEEMHNGTLEKIEPIHFLMNLFSLLSYPLIMAPLYRQLFQISEKKFSELIGQRKEIILKMLFTE
ncbi:TetR/AcrR family transcriptional regulator [Pedobacter miscanthi]|uniref:TetR/AcrR family transcriptional regulator n=1 Tax=Pedobacter miscanthi TaxID=2259170 RepID=A0A366LCX9_9SPHI|nr:TetR/AcrR family transcriptional regulator [Pedobacter miscanthi]RBQ11757.1 TetR/AcrR family transcriptional regulator [Pedobacter miscanthi]